MIDRQWNIEAHAYLLDVIVWMRLRTCGGLGNHEEKIIEHLAKSYATQQQGRRKPLGNVEWYELK